MQMSTLGEFLRAKRVLEYKTLRSAAKFLSCTPTYLCYVEQGVRPMPEKWRNMLPEFYNMTDDEVSEFNCLADKMQNFVKIDCMNLDMEQISFARKFGDVLEHLSDKDICAIEEILDNV